MKKTVKTYNTNFSCSCHWLYENMDETFFYHLSSDTIRDDLQEIKGEIGSVSEKLKTLKTPATEDEGQFPKSCIP